MTTSLRIKNWDSYQHYKHRTPPWIKLHRSLLDDMDYHACDPMAAKHLPLIWLIASENGGNLPTVEKLAFRLRISAAKCGEVINALSAWIYGDVLQDASNMLAECKQHAMPEKSRVETETEKRREECGAHAPTQPASNPPTKQPKAKTFKTWTADEFFDECNRIHDSRHILTDRQGTEFYSYWTEPTASGRIKVNTQTTWDTARRMHTWRKIDDERQAKGRR
jgi:hypothetical protein